MATFGYTSIGATATGAGTSSTQLDAWGPFWLPVNGNLSKLSLYGKWASGSGSNIVGATSSTYTLTSADLGHQVKCVVTATSDGGATSQTSSNTITVPLYGFAVWSPIEKDFIGVYETQSDADVGARRRISRLRTASGLVDYSLPAEATGSDPLYILVCHFDNSGVRFVVEYEGDKASCLDMMSRRIKQGADALKLEIQSVDS